MNNRLLILFDMQGKQLGKELGYASKALEELLSGQTLIVGKYEVEIVTLASTTEVISGKAWLPRQVKKKKMLFDPTSEGALILNQVEYQVCCYNLTR